MYTDKKGICLELSFIVKLKHGKYPSSGHTEAFSVTCAQMLFWIKYLKQASFQFPFTIVSHRKHLIGYVLTVLTCDFWLM